MLITIELRLFETWSPPLHAVAIRGQEIFAMRGPAQTQEGVTVERLDAILADKMRRYPELTGYRITSECYCHAVDFEPVERHLPLPAPSPYGEGDLPASEREIAAQAPF